MIRGWYNQNKKHQCHWGTESTTDDTNRDGSLSSPWTSIEEKNPQSWPSNQRPPPSWATAPICWCRARRPCQLHHVRPQQRDADSCTICPILIQQISTKLFVWCIYSLHFEYLFYYTNHPWIYLATQWFSQAKLLELDQPPSHWCFQSWNPKATLVLKSSQSVAPMARDILTQMRNSRQTIGHSSITMNPCPETSRSSSCKIEAPSQIPTSGRSW